MLISFSFLFVAEDKNYFCNREFSFTLKDDVYLRYKSFANERELKDEILKLNPYKIDIGAVYTTKVNTLKHPSTPQAPQDDMEATRHLVSLCLCGFSLCCQPAFAVLNLCFFSSVFCFCFALAAQGPQDCESRCVPAT